MCPAAANVFSVLLDRGAADEGIDGVGGHGPGQVVALGLVAPHAAEQLGLVDRFVDDKLSFGGDIFLAGNVYLNFDLGLLSHQGNQFFAPAIGLGYEF